MSLPLQLGLAAFCITLGIRLALRTDRLLPALACNLKSQLIRSMSIWAFLVPLFWFCLFVIGPIAALLISLVAACVSGPHLWELTLSIAAIVIAAFGWWKMRR